MRTARDLIVFPNELALRRFQQEAALEQGWVDASAHLTFARLRGLCEPYTTLKGTPLKGVQRLLTRRQVVEVARGHFDNGGPLAKLPTGALNSVLDQLIGEMAQLPEQSVRMVDWLLEQHPKSKLRQLGLLYSIWRATLKQEGFADPLDLNLALLRLLKGPREKWPPLLRDARSITFRSIRWLNPFEESCILAINHKMRLHLQSALPAAHADETAERLEQRIQTEVLTDPWSGWTEDLGDALAVDDADLLADQDKDRITFSRSAGVYGEIEDLARRICRALEQQCPAHRIALIIPEISAVQDIIPHIFDRFNIPYFFRRGRPLLASPCVKSALAWLALPLRPERDALIDLIRNPALTFEQREEAISELLRRKTPPRLDLDRPFSYEHPELNQLIDAAQNRHRLSGVEARSIIETWIPEPDDHFNAEARRRLLNLLDEFGPNPLALAELIDLLEELLENETIRPRNSHEHGVWIINPRDAVGLQFDLVLFAGLNEGKFPAIPQQDALLNDIERYHLRTHLEEHGARLPKLALPEAQVLFHQQSILFLGAIGMARQQLVLSCQSTDQDGNEKNESELFRKLWRLAGWPASEKIQIGAYDEWRIQQLVNEPENLFAAHVERQQQTAAEDRIPMPGESFLPTIPLPLCRAADEALQTAANRPDATTPSPTPPTRTIFHTADMLAIESEREAYREQPLDQRPPSAYCGHLGDLKHTIEDWLAQKEELGATALEALARNRYIFLIEQVFGLREARTADDTPDPMERGGLIHSILQIIYQAIADGSSGINAPRHWAVQSAAGWIRRNEGGTGALPLATFAPHRFDDYLAFARSVAEEQLGRRNLGHRHVWDAERRKILEIILNFVQHDVETCAAENRYPALFESTFGGETALNLGQTSIKGVIDRIDLIFEETGQLAKIRVLDYKGPSRARSKREEYLNEIEHNLDCQLPLYGFAAQQHFFDTFNTDQTNAKTEAGYLFYERDISKLGKTAAQSLIPLDEPGLTTTFLNTLNNNLQAIRNADFTTDPLIAAYTDYTPICRTSPINPDELER